MRGKKTVFVLCDTISEEISSFSMCTYTEKIETQDPGGKKKVITLDAIDRQLRVF